MNGTRPSPRSLKALVDILKTNTSLRYLNLKGGLMNLEAVFALLNVLGFNSTLQNILLPDELGLYNVMTKDRKVHALKANTDTEQKEGHPAIEVDTTRINEADPESQAEANQILAHIAANTNIAEIFTAPQAVLDKNRRQVLSHIVQNELTRRMATLLFPSPAASEGEYDDVAGVVVKHLGEDLALRSAVRVSEVNKRTAVGATTASPYARELVKRDNAEAVARGREDSAPLEVNKVNLDGANEAIANAVLANNPQGVVEAFAAGAIDFKGLGRLAAGQSKDLLAAFPAPAPLSTPQPPKG